MAGDRKKLMNTRNISKSSQQKTGEPRSNAIDGPFLKRRWPICSKIGRNELERKRRIYVWQGAAKHLWESCLKNELNFQHLRNTEPKLTKINIG